MAEKMQPGQKGHLGGNRPSPRRHSAHRLRVRCRAATTIVDLFEQERQALEGHLKTLFLLHSCGADVLDGDWGVAPPCVQLAAAVERTVGRMQVPPPPSHASRSLSSTAHVNEGFIGLSGCFVSANVYMYSGQVMGNVVT